MKVELRGPFTDVWLRRNIRDDVADDVYGSDVTYWEADEVYGVLDGAVTEDEVRSRFNELWDAFEESAMTDRELAETRVSELSEAIADLSEAVSDGAVDMVDVVDAIADLSAMVSDFAETIASLTGGE